MSNNYRASWHDYTQKAIYHITLKKRAALEDFSHINDDGSVKYFSTGCAITRALLEIHHIHPAIKLMQYIVMPDHLYMLLRVSNPLDDILDRKLAAFKVVVNKYSGQERVFDKGFHDRIITHKHNLNVVFEYIRDNPRRLLVRQRYPQFFSRLKTLNIDGTNYHTYGNSLLLQNPFKEAVIIHRKDTEIHRKRNRERWLYVAANGGVLSLHSYPRQRRVSVKKLKNTVAE